MLRHVLRGFSFVDRADAGRKLAERLLRLRGDTPMVMALPRGGVVVAFEVALALDAPLDVVVARKLGAPGHEELGIGAIAPHGVRVLDERAIAFLGITPAEIAAITARETQEAERRSRRYHEDRPPPSLGGRTVILVDDGLATGATARAAVRFVRQQEPRRLILAVPVCSPEAAELLRSEVDEVVCLQAPPDFIAVGFWYQRFEQTSDEEVIALLRRAAGRPQASAWEPHRSGDATVSRRRERTEDVPSSPIEMP